MRTKAINKKRAFISCNLSAATVHWVIKNIRMVPYRSFVLPSPLPTYGQCKSREHVLKTDIFYSAPFSRILHWFWVVKKTLVLRLTNVFQTWKFEFVPDLSRK